ncbi:neuroparsin-A-like isoform X1 [Vespa velutina]|uniref:neuroparsin-A-like isoform X1 n=2 Tax=Vespa velutina TaxID=202808 RepID=UPI001FB2CC9D|nr:neuroparsin-A-like isoform X1 [Vespa velutina]
MDTRNDMSGQSTYVLMLLSFIFVSSSFAHPFIRQREDVRQACKGCGRDCDKCKYGFTISDLCDVPVCKRGPGEICGGPSDSWGVCGAGLICSCNKCIGCSIEELECYSHTCPPHLSLETRHSDAYYRFPTAK